MTGRFSCFGGLPCGFDPCVCATPLRPAPKKPPEVVLCEKCWGGLAVEGYRWCRHCLERHAGFGQREEEDAR